MEKEKKQQIVVQICCILASFCLWLYISYCENPINTYKLKNVSVELTNTEALEQSKLTTIPDQNYMVSFTIRGQNLDVMKAKKGDFKVVADMSLYVLKKGHNRIPVQIIHYPSNINVENTENMWVDVELDELEQKTVDIDTRVQGSPKSGYYYYEGISNPEKVKVSGPKKYVDLVNTVVANVNISGMSKDAKFTSQLEAHDVDGKVISNVKILPSSASIIVPIKHSKKIGINLTTAGQVKNGININPINVDNKFNAVLDNLIAQVTSVSTIPNKVNVNITKK